MTIELKIPDVGESIHDVQIGQWLKQEGDRVEHDETVVELETDKASMELPAPASGVIVKILKHEGDTVSVGDVIAQLEPDDQASDCKTKEDTSTTTPKKEADTTLETRREELHPEAEPAAPPSVRRLMREHHVSADEVKPTGAGGRLLREDVLRYVNEHEDERANETAPRPESGVSENKAPDSPSATRETSTTAANGQGQEQIVPMSLIRRRIAERLVEARQNAALVTTFNEIDMSSVMSLRTAYRELFQKKYGVKLGFMSFFVKATVDALVRFPAVNAEVRGTDIVYRSYCHIGVAIGGGKGLVVPVLRNAQRMSFAEIEQAIGDFATRAESNKLEPSELAGGTFTISNGGIYGSLLSTPIVNPPQSGVLGMHAIQERPVVRDAQIVVRSMMYIALTYDHRIVDGREAVTFLKRIKETIEEPSRLLIGI